MKPRDYRDALIGGSIGALMVSAAGVFLSLFGLNYGLEVVWATLLGFGQDTLGWWLGFVIHVIFGAIVGIGYLMIFVILCRFLNHWFIGAMVGLMHSVFLGFLFGLSPRVCPILFGCPQWIGFTPSLPDVMAWLGLHTIYGITVWTLFEEVEEGRRLYRYLPPGFAGKKID